MAWQAPTSRVLLPRQLGDKSLLNVMKSISLCVCLLCVDVASVRTMVFFMVSFCLGVLGGVHINIDIAVKTIDDDDGIQLCRFERAVRLSFKEIYMIATRKYLPLC